MTFCACTHTHTCSVRIRSGWAAFLQPFITQQTQRQPEPKRSTNWKQKKKNLLLFCEKHLLKHTWQQGFFRASSWMVQHIFIHSHKENAQLHICRHTGWYGIKTAPWGRLTFFFFLFLTCERLKSVTAAYCVKKQQPSQPSCHRFRLVGTGLGNH